MNLRSHLLWGVAVLVALGLGWLLRYWWELHHPVWLVVPAVREGEDETTVLQNTAALQHAMDVASRLPGRPVVRVPNGTYGTKTLQWTASMEGDSKDGTTLAQR